MIDKEKLKKAQAAQIERVREALRKMQRAQGKFSDDWSLHGDAAAERSERAYAQSAYWLEEALGDTDD